MKSTIDSDILRQPLVALGNVADRAREIDVPDVHLPFAVSDIDTPDLSAVGDAIADVAGVAGRTTTRLARRGARVGLSGLRLGARGGSRAISATTRAAWRNPRRSAGITVVMLALIVGLVANRRRSAAQDEQSTRP